jgi:hypothetical protein
MKVVRVLVVLAASVAIAGCTANQGSPPAQADKPQRPVWSPPPDSTRSLIAALDAERDSKGAVVFKGRILLPPGTTVWLTVKLGKRLDEPIKVHLGADGSFVSKGYTRNDSPPRAGRYRIEVVSWFNGAWQSPDVLNLVGEDGANLPKAALMPVDREFPLAAGRLEEVRTITFPELSQDMVAIEAVRNARLSTPEHGLSADPVKGVVAWFESAETHADGWTAAQSANGCWVVTLHIIDNQKPIQAQWEYNPQSKTVRYLDPVAKTFSWLPSE